MDVIPMVKTVNGLKLPIVGFGTWQANDDDLENALNIALESGYRHIDTAYAYQNEHVIGKVLHSWFSAGKLSREDVFIVTKLPNIANRPDHVAKFLDLSLKKLKLDYVDLYLIHTPFGLHYHGDDVVIPLTARGEVDVDYSTDIIAIWQAMEKLVDGGKVKHIGVSNFTKNQVERILGNSRITPSVNQIQLHAYLQQPELVQYLKQNDIVVTSYSTLGTPQTIQLYNACGITKELPSVLNHKVVLEVANKVGKSAAQVLLRHMIQNNIVVIPKSVNPNRIKENCQLFDFTLDDSQMEKLNNLDENLLILDFKAVFKKCDTHPEYPFLEMKSQ